MRQTSDRQYVRQYHRLMPPPRGRGIIIMVFKYELRFAAFSWPNLCSLDLSLLFIVLVSRNFVSGIYKLKPKVSFKNTKENYFLLKTYSFFPALVNIRQTG